jgi:uncharacterized radical SAM superfamily Fe-S cluster-containing enzyme
MKKFKFSYIRAVHWEIKFTMCYFEEQKLYSRGFKWAVYEFSAQVELSNSTTAFKDCMKLVVIHQKFNVN